MPLRAPITCDCRRGRQDHLWLWSRTPITCDCRSSSHNAGSYPTTHIQGAPVMLTTWLCYMNVFVSLCFNMAKFPCARTLAAPWMRRPTAVFQVWIDVLINAPVKTACLVQHCGSLIAANTSHRDFLCSVHWPTWGWGCGNSTSVASIHTEPHKLHKASLLTLHALK